MFSLGRSVDRICAVKIVITGGTGFLGRPLAAALAAQGHEVVVLSRFAGGTYQGVRHQRVQIHADAFDQDAAATIASADAVINLAGAGIADERWTPARKAVLRQSRTSVTRAVATALKASTKPCVLVSGSAVGYYGSSLEATFDETAPAGSDFLATLCADWEREALAAASATCRVVLLRPESRGSLHITSADPAAKPKIFLNALSTENDRAAIRRGVRMVREIAAASPLAPFIERETWAKPLPGRSASRSLPPRSKKLICRV